MDMSTGVSLLRTAQSLLTGRTFFFFFITPTHLPLIGGVHTVSHFSYAPFFQGPHFSKKYGNRTFSMLIYLMTFYLFDDIEK